MSNRKTAIITGAANGIGRATAIRYAKAGYCLCLVDRDEAGLQNSHAQIAGDHQVDQLVCIGDLANQDFLHEVVDKTMAAFGSIDVLINNAAWRTIETMRSIDIETWEKTIRICLTAPAFLAKLAAQQMEKKGSGGVIINVSSMMSDRPAGNSPAYIAAKGGLDSLTRELAVTYGRSGIRAICVKPGFINTDLSKDYKAKDGEDLTSTLSQYLLDATPMNRAGTAEDVAEAIFWLSTEQASFISGTSLMVDGGFTTNMNSYPLKGMHFPNEY
jgi:NAD(P)-dependent dehydrogenase (short-subunit alcohol dehydrogenase family)